MEKIERQFDTNVIGLLAVTKAVLPHFRANKGGVIVNISSVGGKMTFPLGTLYHGTKFAVEGLSEALSFELDAIGVRVKIVESGVIKAIFLAPAIVTLLRYAERATSLTNGLALRQGHLGFAQHADNLFWGVAFTAHFVLLSRGQNEPNSLNKSGPLLGGHSKTIVHRSI